jgi:hypothetical protein
MAALAWLAHGGVYGAIGEGAVAAVVAGLFVGVWLRSRGAETPTAELRDDDQARTTKPP